MEIVEIVFKHWKTGDHLTRIGRIVHDNPASDRLILKLDNGSYEDIIKETIVEVVNVSR